MLYHQGDLSFFLGVQANFQVKESLFVSSLPIYLTNAQERLLRRVQSEDLTGDLAQEGKVKDDLIRIGLIRQVFVRRQKMWKPTAEGYGWLNGHK